jgi:hypothetical protein
VDIIYLVEEAKSAVTICLISKELAVSNSWIFPTNHCKPRAKKLFIFTLLLEKPW